MDKYTLTCVEAVQNYAAVAEDLSLNIKEFHQRLNDNSITTVGRIITILPGI